MQFHKKRKQLSEWKAPAQTNAIPQEKLAITLMKGGCSDQQISLRETILLKKGCCSDQKISLRQVSNSLNERQLLKSIRFLEKSKQLSLWKAAAQINALPYEL